MKDQLRSLRDSALGIGMLLLIVVAGVVFLRGAAWAVENILDFAIAASNWALIVDVLVLPLVLIRRTRGAAGTVWFVSSFVFGVVAWLYGFGLTYQLWGGVGVLAGLAFFGAGVVPLGLVAAALNGLWVPFWNLMFVLGLTFGVRLAGTIANAYSGHSEDDARPIQNPAA